MSAIRLLHSPSAMHPILKGGPANWVPERIAYLKLGFSGSLPSYTYSYVGNSGYFRIPAGTTPLAALRQFLTKIRATSPGDPGSPDDPITVTGSYPLDFQLTFPSFLVFQLDPTLNWQFSFSADGVTTNDTSPQEYFSLVHVLDNGTKIPASGVTQPTPGASAPISPCHIAYFSAISPSAWGQQEVVDSFNMNIYFPGGGAGTGDQYIDPDIKNTGHTGLGGDGQP